MPSILNVVQRMLLFLVSLVLMVGTPMRRVHGAEMTPLTDMRHMFQGSHVQDFGRLCDAFAAEAELTIKFTNNDRNMHFVLDSINAITESPLSSRQLVGNVSDQRSGNPQETNSFTYGNVSLDPGERICDRARFGVRGSGAARGRRAGRRGAGPPRGDRF